VHELPVRQIEGTCWCALQPFPQVIGQTFDPLATAFLGFLGGRVDAALVEVDLVVIDFRDGRGTNPGEGTESEQTAD
jgi:hypothetical protein